MDITFPTSNMASCLIEGLVCVQSRIKSHSFIHSSIQHISGAKLSLELPCRKVPQAICSIETLVPHRASRGVRSSPVLSIHRGWRYLCILILFCEVREMYYKLRFEVKCMGIGSLHSDNIHIHGTEWF